MGPGPRRPAVAAGLRAALLAAFAISGCGVGPQGSADMATAPPAADLAASERMGGHTLARHVGRTDDELRERLRSEPSISAASTYSNRATAERVVATTLQRFSRRVQSWSARTGSRPNLALDFQGVADAPVGRSLRRGAARARDCEDAVVVLRWHRSGVYYVLTSYPECRP